MKTCGWCLRQFTRPMSKDPEFCDRLCDKESRNGIPQACARCTGQFELKGSKRTSDLRKYCTVRCIALSKMPILDNHRDPKWDKVSKEVRQRDGYQCKFFEWFRDHWHLLNEDEQTTIQPYLNLSCTDVKTAHHRYKKSVFPEHKYDHDICVTICTVHHKPVIHLPELQPIMFKVGLLVSRRTEYYERNGEPAK